MRQKGDDHYESYEQRYAKDVVKPFFFVRFKIKHYGARITYVFCHCKDWELYAMLDANRSIAGKSGIM